MSDGKVGILPLDFHFSSREWSRLWECGNRALAISKGGGKRWKTCFWFSSFSMARHFHSPARRCFSRRLPPLEAGKQLLFFFLHSFGAGCVALSCRCLIHPFNAKTWIHVPR